MLENPNNQQAKRSVYCRAESIFERLFQSSSSELVWNELSEKAITNPTSKQRKLDFVYGAFDLTQETNIFYTGFAKPCNNKSIGIAY